MWTYVIYIAQCITIPFFIYFTYFYGYTRKFIASHHSYEAIAEFLIVFLCFNFASKTLKFIHYYRRRKGHYKVNYISGIKNIYRIIMGVVMLLYGFGLFGVEAKTLLTSMSIVAAAIAIVSKEFINDLIVGIYYSFTSNIEINDYVKLSHHKGKILEIGLVKVKLLNDDDDIVIIPNSKVYSQEIVNYSKGDISLMSIDFQLELKSIKSIESLENELITALDSFKDYIEDDSYNLKIEVMKKDSLDLKFQYTLKEANRDLQRRIRKKTVRVVLNYVSQKRSA